MSNNNIPEALLSLVKKTFTSQKIDVTVCSDLTHDMNFGQEWLLATRDELAVFSENGTEHSPRCLKKLSAINKIRTVQLIGGGYVEIETDKNPDRLIFFTNAKKSDFSHAVSQINGLINGKFTEQTAQKSVHRKSCEICGHPIPEEYNKCPRCTEKGKIFIRLLSLLRNHIKTMAIIFLALIGSTLFGLIVPYMSKLFVDVILKPNAETGSFDNAHWLPFAALGLLIGYVGQNLFTSLYLRVSGIFGHETVYNIRAQVYEKYQELSLAYFDKHTVGSLMARVNQDTRELQRLLVDFVPISLESLFLLIGVGTLLFILSWQLTCFVFLPIIFLVFILKKIFYYLRNFFRRFYHRRSLLSALVNDSLHGMRVIKSFGQEKEELKKFDRRSAAFRDAGIDVEKKWSTYRPMLQLFIMSGSVLVWFIGGNLILVNKMTLGSVVAYSGYLAMFYGPIWTLTRMIEYITSALSAADRVFDILDTEPLIFDSPNAVPIDAIHGEIRFKNVTFGYDRFKPIIKNMNLSISENEVIGLVEKSGAGKSTIINLVCRLYDVDRGYILIDGIDIKNIKYSDIRRQIGVVLQETFLFNGTIYENICYARPEATIPEVIAASMAANAHDFIMKMPDGYDSDVGERGDRLSGGEKQRISIARAILRNPRILILDEATSSLDTETENKIQQALKNLTKGRTTIAIAHRLSTLRNCDRLFVIDDGELKEVGTHNELMKKKGIFYNLVKIQNELSKIIAVDG